MSNGITMKKYLIFIMLLATFPSCNKSNIGENVYIEYWRGGNKLHINKQCTEISKSHIVEFIKVDDWTEEHTKNDFISLCPKCVSDKDADILKSLITKEPDTISVYY